MAGNRESSGTREQQTQQQQARDKLLNMVTLMGQDMIGHHDNIPDIFNQVEMFDNRQ